MPEINLFKISNKDTIEEIQAKPVLLEKDLQNLIELNMEQFFGEKYSYCKEKSCISLRNMVLSDGIEKVLIANSKSHVF
ncbi:MAG: hypothetical protein ACRC6K_05850 [Fusobacteriaceae bacterium]